jgi:predicted transcriptional regulator
VTCGKQRDAVAFKPFSLEFKTMQWIDEGREISSPVLVSSDVVPPAKSVMKSGEAAALGALNRFPDGATATDWQKTSQQPKSTFTDARVSLMKQGYVDGGGKKGTKYTLTQRGRDHLSQDRSGLVRIGTDGTNPAGNIGTDWYNNPLGLYQSSPIPYPNPIAPIASNYNQEILLGILEGVDEGVWYTDLLESSTLDKDAYDVTIQFLLDRSYIVSLGKGETWRYVVTNKGKFALRRMRDTAA